MIKNPQRILIYQQKFLLSKILNHNPKSTIFLYKNENFVKIEFLKILSKIYNLLIKKSKNTDISTKNIVIVISKSQPQIYNIYIEYETFREIEILRIIFRKYNY